MSGSSVLHHLLEFAQIHGPWVSDTIQPPHSLLPFYPFASIFPSIRVFSNELALSIRWPKYWSFSFSDSSSNEYSGLISFRIDWFDLLVAQGTRVFNSTIIKKHQSFPISQLFALGGQSTGVSASASFLPKKSQGLSPSEWTGWISLQSKGLSRVFSNTTVPKHQFFSAQLSS